MPGFVHTVPGFPIRYDNAALADSADIVAAVTGVKIRVMSAVISMASAGTIKFQSGASTDLMSPLTTVSGGLIIVLPFNPMGWFETVVSEKLNAVLSSAIATTVCITYVHI